jgi:hypothetical protein
VKTIGALLFTLVLSGFSAPRCGATVYQSDGSAAHVQALQNAAHDGDTITLPAGTFSWTARLNITKGITLQGQTTITGAGTSNPVITDATIIQDNTVRGNQPLAGIVKATISPAQSFRMTGLSFVAGTAITFPSIDGAFHFDSHAAAPSTSIRIDHCHFASLYQGKIIWITGWVYGVADHNVIQTRNSSFSFFIQHATYGGSSQYNGNGSWADYPWYGTEKFWFVEDNTIMGSGNGLNSGLIDSDHGGRWVARHNYWKNAIPSTHGTEGGAARGQRVCEFYDNTVNWTIASLGIGQRSGTSMYHDNTFAGIEPKADQLCGLGNYRETPARARPVWGIADGTSVWDVNATESDGTHVDGHPPYLFDSGTDTSSVNSMGIIHDSTKNWAPNQWIGYSIKNTNPLSASYPLGSYVISNTSNTITYFYYAATDANAHLVFNAGDTYQIHRVLTMMDQNGRGKGDQITGVTVPINSTTGTPFWTHEALEPCYSWNNVYTPNGHVLNYHTRVGQPTTVSGIDYFNLGGGFPADTTPSAVSSTYTAALNGVDYTGTYVYPHPLVTGAPTPMPSAAPRSQQHQFPQKKKTKAKKLQRKNQKNGPRKLSE